MQPTTARSRAISARTITTALLSVSITFAFVQSACGTICGHWYLQQPASIPSPRYAHAMVSDSARAVSVLFGGLTDIGPDAQTWEWNSTTWSLALPVSSPAPRYGHAMAYDSARGITTLFGGQDASSFNNETWEWNGTMWTQRVPSAAPSPRSFHAIAYDSARHVTVLFGGSDATGRNAETWEWDGANWLQRFPASAPSARQGHAMAYDSDRNITVLYGGDDGNSNGQTWEWNGSNWTQVVPTIDPFSGLLAPLVHHAMTFSSIQHLVVVYGVTSNNSKQLWGWNGSQWLWQGPLDNLPSSLTYTAISTDPLREMILIFGGAYLNAPQSDTYEFHLYPITFTQQPTDQTACPNSTARFTAIADQQDNPLTYQWRRGTTNLVNSGNISGANSSMLTIDPVTAADAATDYNCVASCHCGSISSNQVALRFNESDCNTNGTTDACESTYRDCDTDGTFDICILPGQDCNTNGTPDACELNNFGGGTAVNSTATPIPDMGSVSLTVSPVQQQFVTDANVQVNIHHSATGQLTLVVSHLATTVTLAAGLGGHGSDYTDTVFDQQSNTPIAAGLPPYLGTFRPQGNLDSFNGLPKPGIWTLTIQDTAAGDTGTILGWSLITRHRFTADCNTDGIPDACQMSTFDCNTDGTIDACDIHAGQPDTNNDGYLDICEALACPTCPGDLNADAHIDAEDIPAFIRCTLATPVPTDICSCSTNLTPAQFISRLLQPGPTPCP